MTDRRWLRKAITGVTFAIGILSGSADGAFALSRYEAMRTVADYGVSPINVTTANVFPAVACYLGFGNLDAHLAPGTYDGVVYGYGLNSSVAEVTIGLSSGKGAGCWDALYFWYAQHPNSCFPNSLVGIDCSAFVSRAWHMSRTNTCGLLAIDVSKPVTSLADVKEGDAFVKCGSHAVLAASTVVNGNLETWEAVGDAYGRCRVLLSRPVSDLTAKQLAPVVSLKLKDDPAAQMLYTVAEPVPEGVRVRWGTVIEKETSGFVVCRGASPGGDFTAISPVISPLGSATQGAEYEYVDTAPNQAEPFYRVKEIETNGRELWHVVTAVVQPPPGARN